MKKNDFGYEQVNKDEHYNKVQEVFNNVANEYDFMNDVMSFGLHRNWKKEFVGLIEIDDENDTKILDLAGGTGDMAKRILKNHPNTSIEIIDKNINYFDADKVGKIIIDRFEKKEFDVCAIFYNQFKNVITQIPQEQQIIPLKSNEEKDVNSESSYEFEPEEDEILSNLLPKNISTQIFKAMLENSASEQGSRMSAMDNATRNAGEMVDKLTIQYNRSRQAAITKELIEIISGAESL